VVKRILAEIFEQIPVLTNGSERANVKIVEGRGSSNKIHEGRAEEGQRKERIDEIGRAHD
jgi:hypothetical protein